jgi:hypothetical protein
MASRARLRPPTVKLSRLAGTGPANRSLPEATRRRGIDGESLFNISRNRPEIQRILHYPNDLPMIRHDPVPQFTTPPMPSQSLSLRATISTQPGAGQGAPSGAQPS